MESNKSNPSVIVIGAGMTGIMLVIKLREAGIKNIILLEKKSSVGGTWRENQYPGVACDVPSHAYTYEFAPNPDWSGMFAPGDEIHRYFQKVFVDHGVDKVTHFDEEVTNASYENGIWTVTSNNANTNKDETYQADLLFSATGILHQAVTPDFKGMDSYKGKIMHSAEWDKSFDVEGKRIGVIGTGSSASQLIPELINTKGTDVTVFQRTPQWLVKVENKQYSEKQKQKFRDKPEAIASAKKWALWVFEKGTTALTSDKWFDRQMHKLMAWNANRYIKQEIKDPELRAKLTPDYKFGCKRVVMNSTFYPAIVKDNAHLITEGIDGFEENGIRTKDGKLHECDLVVTATGFNPEAFMRPMTFFGRDGVSIEEAWKEKAQAYRSICVPQFPNFFLMLGPNSPIGNYSVIAMSEKQAEYAIRLVKEWQAGTLETIEAKPEAMHEWHDMLKANMGKTVWASGCNSWYLDKNGDPLTWPDTWGAWINIMSDLNLDHFHKTARST